MLHCQGFNTNCRVGHLRFCRSSTEKTKWQNFMFSVGSKLEALTAWQNNEVSVFYLMDFMSQVWNKVLCSLCTSLCFLLWMHFYLLSQQPFHFYYLSLFFTFIWRSSALRFSKKLGNNFTTVLVFCSRSVKIIDFTDFDVID